MLKILKSKILSGSIQFSQQTNQISKIHLKPLLIFLYDHFIFISMLTFIDVDTFKKIQDMTKIYKIVQICTKIIPK